MLIIQETDNVQYAEHLRSRLATFKSEVVSGSKLSLLAKWEGQVKSHLSDDPPYV